MFNDLIFYQLFESGSSTYTYILADGELLEAIIIDPVLETVDRDIKLIKEVGLKLKYVLDTHIHADHITAASELRSRLAAKTAVSRDSKIPCADILLGDKEVLHFGKYSIQALATPGHTDSCVSFYCQGMVFTGDSLMIRGTGRTDFQQGSAEKLYDSIHEKLFTLPENTLVYPAHDYRGQSKSTIALEKTWNPRINLSKSRADFKKTMDELKLEDPKKMLEAVPANLQCGKKELAT